MLRFLMAVFMATIAMSELSGADPRPFSVSELLRLKRVADPQISPDGQSVVYQLTEIIDAAKNKKHTHLWLAAVDGLSSPRPLTSSGKSDSHPRWSPDGSKILFESTRGGSSQLYVIDLKAGGEAVKLTSISTGANTGIWSPDGKSIAFVSAVDPQYSTLPFAESDKKNSEAEATAEENPVKAKSFDRLFFRHWDSYVDGKRQHLFVINSNGTECRDVTPGNRDAYPTSTTFSVGDDFTFTPDSQHIVFTAVPANGEAWSTNHDLCRVSIHNKLSNWETLSVGNLAADSGPVFSPDGTKLAWRVQGRPGYEADQWKIRISDCKPDGTIVGEPKTVAVKTVGKTRPGDCELSIEEIVWIPNQNAIVSHADYEGTHPLWRINLADGSAEEFGPKGQVSGPSVSRDGQTVVHLTATIRAPNSINLTSLTKKTTSLLASQHNEELLATTDRPTPESVRVKVEDGDIQMWLLKPPGFDPSKKYPVVYLVHGGPQGAWADGWSFRWNPQVWAARGYVIAMPNPRGSTGFGQKFVDEICGDWGGKCYRDLEAGLKYIKSLPYVDSSRLASAGGSFGGYMQNWFAVSEIAKEFKCLISHCSVYNFESMWGTTDELWFDEWEHQGLPWEKPGSYGEFSPHRKAGNLARNKVPFLIIHNDLDFRCPIGQGHELFAALQRQGIPSRFVNFPDEGHWVLKPANSKRWHDEVFAWLDKYCPPGGK